MPGTPGSALVARNLRIPFIPAASTNFLGSPDEMGSDSSEAIADEILDLDKLLAEPSPTVARNQIVPATPVVMEPRGIPIPGFIRTVCPVDPGFVREVVRVSVPRGYKVISPTGTAYTAPITPQNAYQVVHPVIPQIAAQPMSVVPAMMTFGTQTTPSLRSPPRPGSVPMPTFVPYCDLSTPVRAGASSSSSSSSGLLLPGVQSFRALKRHRS
jgi:hypothetical protein